MSIAARVVPFSRSFRSLIKKRAALAKPIKDLKDLRVLRGRVCYRHSGPKGPEENQRRFFRSANDGEGNPLACACGMRGPKPYDEGGPSVAIASRPGGLSYGETESFGMSRNHFYNNEL